MGIEVSEHHFFTSAMATADFLNHQLPTVARSSLRRGLREALLAVGYTITDDKPDYVIVGTTRT
jgi:NagD protein